MLGNRFYQKFYLHCGRCKGIQRAAQGYRPIPNPILFDSDAHCRSFHNEQRRAKGFVGMRVSCRCETCHRVHSDWKVLDAQEFIDIKLKMSPEDRQRLLWKTENRGAAS